MKKLLIFSIVLLIPVFALAADTEVQNLDAIVSPAGTDVLYIVDDPAGTPLSAKITIANLLVDGLIPNDITITLAGTATALAANGANCNAGSYPLGVDASGAVESCTDATTEIDTAIATAASNYEPAGVSVADITDATANGRSLISAANYAAMKTLLDTDDIQTLTGVAAGTAHLGTFTGTTIADSQTIKAALQALETAVEASDGDVTAAAAFAVDNVLIKSDGTGKGVQATGITIADTTNNMSGIGDLTVDGAVIVNEAGADKDFRVEAVGEANALFVQGSDGRLGFGTGVPQTRAEFLGLGASLPVAGWFADVVGVSFLDDQQQPSFLVGHASATADNQPLTFFRRSRGTLAIPSIVVDGDDIGSLLFSAHDGTDFENVAEVKAIADGTMTTNSIPTSLVFATGVSTGGRAERMRISPTGDVSIAGLTASEIVGTDASKNLVSLAVATYPSLTELSYVKGLSSAVQTQITAKGAHAGQVWTGVHDFGGATSVEIPNGTAPTVDAAGEIAVDTTTDQLIYYGGAKRVVTYIKSPCAVVPDLAAADDNLPLGSTTYARTITKIGCRCNGTCTTPATITLEDTGGNAMTITGTNPTCATTGDITYAAVTAGNTLGAGEGLRMDVTNAVSPETDDYEICWEEVVTAD